MKHELESKVSAIVRTPGTAGLVLPIEVLVRTGRAVSASSNRLEYFSCPNIYTEIPEPSSFLPFAGELVWVFRFVSSGLSNHGKISP